MYILNILHTLFNWSLYISLASSVVMSWPSTLMAGIHVQIRVWENFQCCQMLPPIWWTRDRGWGSCYSCPTYRSHSHSWFWSCVWRGMLCHVPWHGLHCSVWNASSLEMPLHFVTHWWPLTCCWWGCFGSIRSKRVSLLWSWPSATLPITWCACQMESHGKKSCPQLLVLSLLDVITCHLALKGKSVKPFSMTIIFPWNY